MRARRLLLTIAASGALMVLPPSAGAATSCAGADSAPTAAGSASATAAILCLVNAERSARGLPVLAPNAKLALAAQRHTDDMLARHYFAHVARAPAPFGADLGARAAAAGYAFSFVGENIAAGQSTPREAMSAWMASAGHCANILSPDATELGVGAAPGSASLRSFGATWTQEFGNPLGRHTPATSSAAQAACPYATLIGGDAAADAQDDADAASAPAAAAAGSTGHGGGTPTVTAPTQHSEHHGSTQTSAARRKAVARRRASRRRHSARQATASSVRAHRLSVTIWTLLAARHHR